MGIGFDDCDDTLENLQRMKNNKMNTKSTNAIFFQHNINYSRMNDDGVICLCFTFVAIMFIHPHTRIHTHILHINRRNNHHFLTSDLTSHFARNIFFTIYEIGKFAAGKKKTVLSYRIWC